MNEKWEENTSKSSWIKVVDEKNSYRIDNFSYEFGIDENLVKPHCVTCTAVNGCWFKNEVDKKPKPMTYTFGIVKQIMQKFKMNATLGLYHPFCHCKEIAIPEPLPTDIKTIVPNKKWEYTVDDKRGTIMSMGYTENDFNEVQALLLELTKEAYSKSNYRIRQIDKYGCRVTIFLSFPGKHEKQGRLYPLKTGWSIFPDGSIKNNTFIGGIID